MELAGRTVWVAGHRGMVGAAVVRRLAREDVRVLTVDRADLDLTDGHRVREWVAAEKPDVVVLAAAKVGGILANDELPYDFLQQNLAITTNVIDASVRAGVPRLLNLGSSCIYPKHADQPITEDELLTGPLEPTNQWYAIAKIAGVMLTAAARRQHGLDYISGMPTNLYGPGDNYDLHSSHVMPALIRKAHDAKAAGADAMTIWGSGTVRREFLHVDDCADACVHLLETYSAEQHINIGTGQDIVIVDLARLVARVVGFAGEVRTDPSKPDGTPRKLLDVTKLQALGWSPAIALEEGIAATYQSYLAGEGRNLAA